MTDLFLKIVNMSICASWLVLVVMGLRLILKKTPKWVNVLLWGIVAVRLIWPFSMESVLSLIPSAQTISPEIMLDPAPSIDSGVNAINRVVNPIIVESFAPSGGASANPLQIWIPISAGIWIAGMVLMLLYTAVSYWRLTRQVETAVHIGENVWRSEFVPSPFILGVIRPRVYLPASLAPKDMPHVLAHERSHISRKDHWWKPLGFLLLSIHWFNPLIWAAYILLCRDIELACDERVIKELGVDQRADYSEALLACSVHRKRIAACPLAFGEVGVKERVRSVLNYKKPGFWIVLVAVIVCIVVAVTMLTDPVEKEQEDLVNSIIQQDGYTITGQTKKSITLTLPMDKLPEEIYSGEGCTFDEDEFVLWNDEGSSIYLKEAKLEDAYVMFCFDFSYEVHQAGSIVAPYRAKIAILDNTTTGVIADAGLKSEDIIVDGASLAKEGAYFRGQGADEEFIVNVKTEVLRSARESITFTMSNFYNISFMKDYEQSSENSRGYAIELLDAQLCDDMIWTTVELTFPERVDMDEITDVGIGFDWNDLSLFYCVKNLVNIDTKERTMQWQLAFDLNEGGLTGQQLAGEEVMVRFASVELDHIDLLVLDNQPTVTWMVQESGTSGTIAGFYVFWDFIEDGYSETYPTLQLMEDGTFQFAFNGWGGVYWSGNYLIDDGQVVLNTEDGKYHYTFKFDGSDLIFVAEESSEELGQSGLYDGAELGYGGFGYIGINNDKGQVEQVEIVQDKLRVSLEQVRYLAQNKAAGGVEAVLSNCHNGQSTRITASAFVDEIAVFLGSISFDDPKSGKGYYEGSYTVEFISGGEELLTLTFGDMDTVYYGTGEDGYPVQYTLQGVSISQITQFLSQYDESIADPDWGVELTVQDVTPTGLTLVCTQSGGNPTGELSTGSYLCLEVWQDGCWVPVDVLGSMDYSWTAEAVSIPMGGTTQWEVDWINLFGELQPGQYRIGKEIMDFSGSGDYDIMIVYAEFEIK